MLACEINARAINATGSLDLTELGPYEAHEDRRSNGFTPASREVIVVRDASAAVTGGSAALQVGVHPSKKFASIKDVVKALTPQESDHYGPWLQKWEQLLYASEDVIVG